MKIKILSLLLLSSFILSALTAVPSKINYQGIITDIDGSPIVSSANTITALLYATELGGAALYTQSFVDVNSDTNGMYSIEVGDSSLQSVLEGNSELWLELIINEQTLSPRQKINSVPYALVAKAAESIVPGSDTDAAISTNTSDIQAHNVRINTLESGSTVWTNNASNIQAHNVRINMLESGATVWSSNASDIQDHDVRINTLESGSTVWTTNASDIQAHDVRINTLEGGATMWTTNASDIQAHDVRINTLEGGAMMWMTNALDIQAHDVRINTLEGGATMWTTNASDISALQAELELNPAKELVQYGFEENLFLSETTSESSSGGFNYAGSTHFISGTPASDLDVSDRILLVAQNSAHQNGIYVVLHKEFGNAYIIRAEDFNSDEDVSLGIFTVIEKGVLSGEGFVLDLIAENFILDDQTNGNLGFSKFTNSALETRLDSLEAQSPAWLDNYNSITNNSTRLDSLEAQSPAWLNNYNSITNNSTRLDSLEAQSPAWLNNYNSITNNSTRLDSLEAQSPAWLDNYNFITNNTIQISNNANSIAAIQLDIDQNESDADAAIAALQAVDASSARQFVVDFGFTYAVSLNANIGIDLYNYGDDSVYSCEVGDTVLLTGQSNSSENGIYEITNVIGSGSYRSVSLVRSTNYDTAEELNEGDLVLIEKGESNGLAFMLGAISETFVLGNDALTWYRCGINTNQDIDFAGTVSAQGLNVSTPGGYITFNGMDNRISSSFETRFDGNDVRFTNDDVRFENDEVRFQNYGGVDFDTDVEFNSTVTVQAPTQDNEVANKAYVDGVVVPPGGLIAWPVASGIPTGWSDAGLSSPMTDYIWIRKD